MYNNTYIEDILAHMDLLTYFSISVYLFKLTLMKSCHDLKSYIDNLLPLLLLFYIIIINQHSFNIDK